MPGQALAPAGPERGVGAQVGWYVACEGRSGSRAEVVPERAGFFLSGWAQGWAANPLPLSRRRFAGKPTPDETIFATVYQSASSQKGMYPGAEAAGAGGRAGFVGFLCML